MADSRAEDDQDQISSSGPSKKRSRVSRACDQCRAGREKCDGAYPSCKTCGTQKRPCSYDEQPKKRGIRPQYIRTLELTLAWLLHTFPEVEAQLAAMLPNPDAVVPRLIAGNDDRAETWHQAKWRDGIISKQLDQLLSGTTVIAFEPPTPVPTGHVGVTIQLTEVPQVESRDMGVANGSLDLAKLKLPNDAWMLLDFYFAFTHNWLPIVEKSSILKVVYSYPAEGVSTQTASTAEHAELWSILALVASQLTRSGRRGQDTTLRDTAQNLLPSEYGASGLGHTKALLLLGLIDITNEKWLPAWLTVGSAIRILFCHRDLDFSGNTAANEMYNHVFLAAFVLESAIAVEIGAPTHIGLDRINTIGFINEEGLEEWSPWVNPLEPSSTASGKAPARSYSTFNNVLRLTISHLKNGRRVRNPTSSVNEINVILALAQNSSCISGQIQPRIIVAQRMSFLTGILPDNTHTFGSTVTYQSQIQQTPHSSLPTGSPHSVYAGSSTELWPHEATSIPKSGHPIVDVDIFEELAMLERTDAQQHPQFMQNLGFAPDLDLAEFFGADYLPSDPMLAYMQPGFTQGGSDDHRLDAG